MDTIVLNERNCGTRATRLEVDTMIDFLNKRGYSIVYGAYSPKAGQAIKRKHWNAAQRAASKAAANAPTLRRLEDLPLGEQIELLEEICAYLTDKYLVPALFGEAVAS